MALDDQNTSLLAGGAGEPDATNAPPPANPQGSVVGQAAPTPPAPIADTRTFTQKLLQGLLAGAAGGAAAPLYQNSSQAGIMGLNNAAAQEQNQRTQIQQKNADQQKQFQDQLAAQDQQAQNQRTAQQNALFGPQLAMANLNQLEAAHRVAQLPEEDQVKYAEDQKKVYDAVAGSGRDITFVDDTHDALDQFFKAHPDKSISNVESIHLPGPNGQAGQVAIITPKPGQTSMDPKVKLNLLKKVGFDTTGLTDIPDKDFLKIYSEASLEQVKQKGENARNATTQAAENGRNQARINAANGGNPTTATPNADSPVKDVADAVASGKQFLDKIPGFGKNSMKSQVVAELARRGVDTAQLQLEEDHAKSPATQQGIQAINTLNGVNGSPGVLDQLGPAMSAANVSSIKQLNQLVNKGNVDLGTAQGKAIQKAHELAVAAQDQYARVLVGNGQSTDAARNQAGTLFDSNFGASTAAGAIEGAKAELKARSDAMSAQSRFTKTQIANTQTPKEGATKQNAAGDTIKFTGGKWQIQ